MGWIGESHEVAKGGALSRFRRFQFERGALQSSDCTRSYHSLSESELYSRICEFYHDLGRRLWEKSSDAVQVWYNDLGEKRCEEQVPLVEVLRSLVLTKDRLLEYLVSSCLVDSAIELYQQQEFDRLIGHFFDRALCFAAEGYERRAATQGKSGPVAIAH